MKASRKQKSAARQTKIRRAAEHFLLHGGKESAGQQTKMSGATDFREPAARIKYEDVLLPESMWTSMKA